jgi:hypothetical protein
MINILKKGPIIQFHDLYNFYYENKTRNTKIKIYYVQKYFDSSIKLFAQHQRPLNTLKPHGLFRRLHALQFQAAQHRQVNVGCEWQHISSRLDLA